LIATGERRRMSAQIAGLLRCLLDMACLPLVLRRSMVAINR
jgi:hypothetical protein